MRFSKARSVAATLMLAGCATMGGTGSTDTSDQTNTTPPTQWPINTYEHVDLWLHGFAMIQDDTTLVPFFRRGYKAEMNDLKRRSNVTTQLDANISNLRNRFAANSRLVNAQFVPLYFSSLDELVQVMDLFERSDGNPRAASNQETANLIQLLAGYFPLPADREWARLFVQSIRDENNRFYRAYWDQQQRERGTVLSTVRDHWQNTYRPRFERFLNNTSQAGGEVILSLPLDGEGRTLTAGKQQNSTAVTFPMRPADADEAIYVIAHELVGQLVQTAVTDNVTPTQTREGMTDRFVAAGTVRAGAMLLQKVAPELTAGYQAYYLRSANRAGGSFTSVFSLPDAIRDAIARQIDIVLGGI
ncbi:MAG TPA: hypothetical protein VFD22_09580 [Gemmatimonadaceae bacterium]|nr:hypothetical protein [Gemmatimonadaceae bacterium]